jgi:hypothetical protein
MLRAIATALPLLLAGAALGQPAPGAASGPRMIEISFAYTVPTPEFRARMDEAAPLLATVPGLVWKVWGIDEGARRASGVYLFRDAAAAESYLADIFAPHMGNSPALAEVVIRRYGVMEAATRRTRGALE